MRHLPSSPARPFAVRSLAVVAAFLAACGPVGTRTGAPAGAGDGTAVLPGSGGGGGGAGPRPGSGGAGGAFVPLGGGGMAGAMDAATAPVDARADGGGAATPDVALDAAQDRGAGSGPDVPPAIDAGAPPPATTGTLRIARKVYEDRLRAMWLAESVANWTGLLSEGQRRAPPFFRDEDWGTTKGNPNIAGTAQGRLTYNFQDPWGADDDTDIEYIYLETMVARATPRLTADDIVAAWSRHITVSEFIWVSNLWAHWGMLEETGAVYPPSTSLYSYNDQALMIDAQLTTELFGALAPGLPGQALVLAELPIRVTASGYAAHAAQFYAALYALAPLVDRTRPAREQAIWLVASAARLIPPGSKARDIIDFVRAQYEANPDRDDWERTRDAIATRYQARAGDNGFRYLEWYEAGVNLATGVMALLYGELDLKRTIKVGTLSGWDSDNGTATIGGLLGLLLGTEAVRAQFAGTTLSDRYDINRTRHGFMNHTGDSRASDTFTLMARRMMPLVESAVRAAGGSVDAATDQLVIPRIAVEALSPNDNPLWTREHLRSANNQVRARGGRVTVTATPVRALGDAPGSADASLAADGLEMDFSGRDRRLPARNQQTFPDEEAAPLYLGLRPAAATDPVTVSVTYDRPVTIDGVRLVEGLTASPAGSGNPEGGWLEGAAVSLQIGDEWIAPPDGAMPRPPQRRERSFEIIDFVLPKPVQVTGVRITGRAGGAGRYATIAELDALLVAAP